MAIDPATLKSAKILIVDDQEANVVLLQRILEGAGYVNITGTTESARVTALCSQTSPDLVLLDLHMPDPDGLEVMRQLAPWRDGRWFPILVLTADITPEMRQKALEGGARDFVTKPFDRIEVLLRIQNLLEVRFLQLELRAQNLALEQRVHEQTQDLRDARLEIIERLALAAEYRDDNTGEHARRVGRTSSLVARGLGLSEEEAELLALAAPLHDVGKIGIPDRILLKPGSLTADEFDVIKGHARIGQFILSESRSPLLQMAEQIAISHHEWWDGSGYPLGLSGRAIPIVGRIVAVADVFDALTHDRPYKQAWPVERALDEVRGLSGRQFDPDVAAAFDLLDHEALLGPLDVSLAAASANGLG